MGCSPKLYKNKSNPSLGRDGGSRRMSSRKYPTRYHRFIQRNDVLAQAAESRLYRDKVNCTVNIPLGIVDMTKATRYSLIGHWHAHVMVRERSGQSDCHGEGE